MGGASNGKTYCREFAVRWIRAWENSNKFALVDDDLIHHALVSPTVKVEGKWLLSRNIKSSLDIVNVWERVGVFDTLEEAKAMGKLIAAAQNP